MNPLMVLGGIAGAQTCRPGLNALRGKRQQYWRARLDGAVCAQ